MMDIRGYIHLWIWIRNFISTPSLCKSRLRRYLPLSGMWIVLSDIEGGMGNVAPSSVSQHAASGASTTDRSAACLLGYVRHFTSVRTSAPSPIITTADICRHTTGQWWDANRNLILNPNRHLTVISQALNLRTNPITLTAGADVHDGCLREGRAGYTEGGKCPLSTWLCFTAPRDWALRRVAPTSYGRFRSLACLITRSSHFSLFLRLVVWTDCFVVQVLQSVCRMCLCVCVFPR